MSKLYILILCVIFVCESQSKQCPEIKLVSNFNPVLYLGKWYQIESYPTPFEKNTKCVQATYTLNANGTVGVLNEAILNPSGAKIEIRGYATPSPSNPANLTVHFPGVPRDGNYWVIDTDYISYSLVYSCYLNENQKRVESAYILSRTRELQTKSVTKLVDELAEFGSDTTQFAKTIQTDCKN